ncbi:MAG: DNA repair protein RecO [Synechococcales bacterium]|nr:DNA repair protein RecO [Synechococcales bacterium]
MGGTYKATGINLKSIPLGESDRLLTVLTRERGVIRVVAPGARKHRSSLRGISNVFVINNLLIAQGRSLDKLVQAESLQSFPRLGQDLGKLTAGQYLAELALCQAPSQQPQEDLYTLLVEHLERLAVRPQSQTLASLVHAMFHLLALAGLAPQVQHCCLSLRPITPDFADPNWRIGFDAAAGGTVCLTPAEPAADRETAPAYPVATGRAGLSGRSRRVAEGDRPQRPASPPETARQSPRQSPGRTSPLLVKLTALELAILQHLSLPDLLQPDGTLYPLIEEQFQFAGQSAIPGGNTLAAEPVWLSLERLLRHYSQYHFDQLIRSAALIETCFSSAFDSQARG